MKNIKQTAVDRNICLKNKGWEYCLLGHVFLVAHVEQAVGLVHDEPVQPAEVEVLGGAEVVEQAAGRRDEHVDALADARLLRLLLLTADQVAGHDPRERFQNLDEAGVRLQHQLARRHHHQRQHARRPVDLRPDPVQFLRPPSVTSVNPSIRFVHHLGIGLIFFTGFYWVLLGYTGFYRVLLDFIEFN